MTSRQLDQKVKVATPLSFRRHILITVPDRWGEFLALSSPSLFLVVWCSCSCRRTSSCRFSSNSGSNV